MCVLLPPMVCSAWLLVVGGQVQNNSLCVQAEGCCTTQSCSSEILPTLYDPLLHHRVHTSPQLFPILSQLNPTNNLPSYFFQIHFNGFFFMLIPPMQAQLFQAGLLAPDFANQNLNAFISSPPTCATVCSNVYGM